MNNFKNKSILITGGTGSFGRNFAKYINQKFNFKKIVIYSRDELKQFDFKNDLGDYGNKFRFLIGDIRDKDRLSFAFRGIDYVIHCAALKQVPATEYNPFECIKTNILGTQNVVECALKNNIQKVISLSTDKAVAPVNLYGASKLSADKLIISANKIKGNQKISFSVVRYGNVLGSRGSILPTLLNQNKKNNFFTITDSAMTRFTLTIQDSINVVIWTLKNSIGGEIVIPKIPSYNIMDLAKAINKNKKIKFIGIRAGEKINEEMVSVNDSIHTIDIKKYYLILPFEKDDFFKKYSKQIRVLKKQKPYSYCSNDNNFLSINQLKKIIHEQLAKNLVQL